MPTAPAPRFKSCAECHGLREAEQFFRSPYTPDGLSATCRTCTWTRARRDREQRERRGAERRANSR
jgi:hypothetical protein